MTIGKNGLELDTEHGNCQDSAVTGMPSTEQKGHQEGLVTL
jgi:hypothetical protein